MLMTAEQGQAQFSGLLKVMTSAKSIDTSLITIPGLATHYATYITGTDFALKEAEELTGGTTANSSCRLVRQIIDNGSIGADTAEGILLVRAPTPTFVGETLTGGTSGGTVIIAQNFRKLFAWNAPKTMLITVETASVNVTFDGTTPTATAGTNLGHTLTAGQSVLIYGIDSIKNFKAINATNGSGAIIKYTLNY